MNPTAPKRDRFLLSTADQRQKAAFNDARDARDARDVNEKIWAMGTICPGSFLGRGYEIQSSRWGKQCKTP